MTGTQNVPPNGIIPATNTRPQITFSDDGSKATVNNVLNIIAGQKLKLIFIHNAFNPDCSVSETQKPAMIITVKPQHGTLMTIYSNDFPDFRPDSPFYKCNDTSVNGEGLYYTALTGYTGQDSFSYAMFASNGHEMDFNSIVNVK